MLTSSACTWCRPAHRHEEHLAGLDDDIGHRRAAEAGVPVQIGAGCIDVAEDALAVVDAAPLRGRDQTVTLPARDLSNKDVAGVTVQRRDRSGGPVPKEALLAVLSGLQVLREDGAVAKE